MKSRIISLIGTGALVSSAFSAHASTVTFNLGTVFSDGSVAPYGPAPYGVVTLDDGGSVGTVTMTIDVSGDVGIADMTQLYLNFDSLFSLNNLSFTYDSGSTGSAASSISVGTDAFQSDGDGAYDILFDFPTASGSTFGAGESVIYSISSTDSIVANSFNFLSVEGGGEGTFLAASKWQSTGELGEDSAWIGSSVVPVPAALWLFGSGLLGLLGVARRK